jgi:DNA-binding GntR family transcriptional regulator
VKRAAIQNGKATQGDYGALIERRAAELRAAADGTENVEQLEAIVRDLEKLIAQARWVEATRLNHGEHGEH